MGRLRVSIASSSWFLTQNLPVEVRDARGELVARSAGRIDEPLPVGLYVVKATLPGGRRHSQVVAVTSGPPTILVLRRGKQEPSDVAPTDTPAPESDENGRAETEELLLDDVTPRADLIDNHGCALREQRGARWIFDPEPDPQETPVATFAVAGTTVSTSIPVNPRGAGDEGAAVVTFRLRGKRIRADAGFARQRRVARTLEGMVKANDVVSMAELLGNADEVLLFKYRDPSAAALGGLTLHRMGRLAGRGGWVENLARDFGWIPDGRVLLAALLSSAPDEGQRARGLDRLLEVAPLRPLFSDGLALMLRLLRTWPDGSRAEERRAALAGITSNPMTIDWDAMSLTTYDEG